MRSSLLAAAVLVLALAGCSDLEDQAKDAVKDAAGDAACSLAGTAVDEAGDQASQAAERIGADPAAAEDELRAVRDALSSAEQSVGGDLKAGLGDAKQAVERLLGEAEAAAAGTAVDKKAVKSAQRDLQTAIDDVREVC